MVFDRETEKRWIAERAPVIKALDALQERAAKLPIRTRLLLNRRANAGEDYATVLTELEQKWQPEVTDNFEHDVMCDRDLCSPRCPVRQTREANRP